MQHCGRAVVQRMGEGCARKGPLQAMLIQGQTAEKRRTYSKRIDGRTNIMNETGQGEPGGAHAPTRDLRSFNYQHGPASLGQANGSRQSIGSGAYDDGIGLRKVELCDFIRHLNAVVILPPV